MFDIIDSFIIVLSEAEVNNNLIDHSIDTSDSINNTLDPLDDTSNSTNDTSHLSNDKKCKLCKNENYFINDNNRCPNCQSLFDNDNLDYFGICEICFEDIIDNGRCYNHMFWGIHYD